jgi:hypothetical protein
MARRWPAVSYQQGYTMVPANQTNRIAMLPFAFSLESTVAIVLSGRLLAAVAYLTLFVSVCANWLGSGSWLSRAGLQRAAVISPYRRSVCCLADFYAANTWRLAILPASSRSRSASTSFLIRDRRIAKELDAQANDGTNR